MARLRRLSAPRDPKSQPSNRHLPVGVNG